MNIGLEESSRNVFLVLHQPYSYTDISIQPIPLPPAPESPTRA